MADLTYRVVVKDDGSPALQKVTDGMKRTESASKKSSLVANEFSKSWRRAAGDVIKGFVGFQAAMKVFSFAKDAVNEYSKAVNELAKQKGIQPPDDVANYDKAVKNLSAAFNDLKIILAENLIPFLTVAIDKFSSIVEIAGKAGNVVRGIMGKIAVATGALSANEVALYNASQNKIPRSEIKAQMQKNRDKEKAPKAKAYSLADDATYNKEAGQLQIDIAAGEKTRMDNWTKMQEEKQAARFKEMEDLNAIVELEAQTDEEQAARDRTKMAREKEIMELKQQAVSSAIGGALALTSLFKDNSKEAFALTKGLAIGQATMNSYMAFTAALGAQPFGPWNFVQAGAALALGLAQVATIAATPYKGGQAKGTSFAHGGMYMTGEEGPEMAYLPRGTRVMNKQQTEQNSGGSININVSGNLIGEDRWVRDNLIPMIRREVSRN